LLSAPSVPAEVSLLRYQQQNIVLHTEPGYGARLPLDFGGNVFRQLSPMLSSSVRMAIEGSSAHVGAPPMWLRRASDVRFLGLSEGDESATILHLEAPTLGEAAEEIYAQGTLWETKPARDDTAVNVLARVTTEVSRGNPDSTFYDRNLLKQFSHSTRLFQRKLVSLDVPDTTAVAKLDRQVALRATELTDRTPSPRQVRVIGHLDMIRHSTRSFEMLLEEGKTVRGVLENGEQIDALKAFLGQTVLVVGKAVYRPSGSLLRVDAQAIGEGTGQPKIFAKIPAPLDHTQPTVRLRISEQAKNGVAGFFGQWPGNETDEELLAMLRDVRG
jgi:hypothetical protein